MGSTRCPSLATLRTTMVRSHFDQTTEEEHIMGGLEAIFRWMHVFAGIIWIGHLYFFNWVNGPFQAKLDAPTRKAVVPELMPRALYWFRWGAAYTWFTGVLLLLIVYYHGQQVLATGAEWSAGPIVMIEVKFLA